MQLLSRVVWSEGMYLGPHHFQVQGRYFEDSIQFAVSSLWFACHGLSGVEIDRDALHNGTFSLLHARGRFADGLVFNMPESDPLPEPRPVADLFPPTRDGVTVHLGIPPRKPDGLNCALDETGKARYVAEARTLHDENTGVDERPVRLGRKNLKLVFDSEPEAGLATLPLARVIRDGSGHFALDAAFVPPVLSIAAAQPLMHLLERIIDILNEKAAAMQKGADGSRTDYSPREIANFWLAHAVNSALAPLRHHLIVKRPHPEELFLELSRLAGALCTFALDSHPRDLPLYDHDNLGDCFERLDRHIRLHLETIVPTTCVSIPLHAAGDYFWEGEITDQRVLGRSRWVFAVRSRITEAELMTRVPQVVKICTPPFVRELVRRALPGMELVHLPHPPQSIPTRSEVQYFGITRSGPCWDHMQKTRRIGVYVPGEFPEPEIEILVALDN
jgi:type VI secretion system protein ImpJ